MFKVEKNVVGKANIKKLWSYYEDTSKWGEWDESINKVIINGDFKKGTEGKIYFSDENIPPLSFILSEVVEEKYFVASSTVGEMTINMIHEIETIEDKVKINHCIEIEGKNKAMVEGIGSALSSQLESSMRKLILLAKE